MKYLLSAILNYALFLGILILLRWDFEWSDLGPAAIFTIITLVQTSSIAKYSPAGHSAVCRQP